MFVDPGGVEPAAHTRSTLPREHTHTDARSAKKDVISTKPQKAMGAERTFPREDKESRRTPSLRSVPRYVSPIGARYPVQSGQAGAGGSPISPVYGWVLSPVSEGGLKVRIFYFLPGNEKRPQLRRWACLRLSGIDFPGNRRDGPYLGADARGRLATAPGARDAALGASQPRSRF